jgi:hypothetical protein
MKHGYTALLALAFTATTITLSAQPAIEWVKRYNAPPDMADEALDIALDAAGNVYVTGSGYNSSGNLDAITTKYDPNGVQVWVRNFDRGVNDNDIARSIALDAAGNVYVTGFSMGTGTSGDVLTVKYDNAGTQQWAMFYNGAANNMDEGKSLAVDATGNVFVCGYSSDAQYMFDALTIAYNTTGTLLWDELYNGPVSGNDELLDIAIDGLSNVYVTGNVEQATADWDILTIKYNVAGVQQWDETYAGNGGGDYGKAITLDANGNVLVGAQSFSTGDWFDYLTLKYTSAGVYQWNARYNNGNNRFEDLWEICTDNAGYVYVTGQSQATGNNSTPPDAATVKYTPAGAQVWVKRFDGGFNNADDRAFAMVLDDTANVYIAGYSKNATNNDYITVKYDSAGTEEYVLRYNSQYNLDEQINAIAVQDGNIYVTGRSITNAPNEDFMTIKYSYAAVGITENSSAPGIRSVFPVPASGVVNINLSPETGLNSQLLIHDLSGRLVQAVTVRTTGLQQIDLGALAEGTYTLSLISAEGEMISSQRIIKN